MNAPTRVIGDTADDGTARRIQVIDAVSGDVIEGVIVADTAAGTVRRFDVENGNIVRTGDDLAIVDEQRDIRIAVIGESGPEIVALPGAAG